MEKLKSLIKKVCTKEVIFYAIFYIVNNKFGIWMTILKYNEI